MVGTYKNLLFMSGSARAAAINPRARTGIQAINTGAPQHVYYSTPKCAWSNAFEGSHPPLRCYWTGPLLTPFRIAMMRTPSPPVEAGSSVGKEAVEVSGPLSNSRALTLAGRLVPVIEV